MFTIIKNNKVIESKLIELLNESALYQQGSKRSKHWK